MNCQALVQFVQLSLPPVLLPVLTFAVAGMEQVSVRTAAAVPALYWKELLRSLEGAPR